MILNVNHTAFKIISGGTTKDSIYRASMFDTFGPIRKGDLIVRTTGKANGPNGSGSWLECAAKDLTPEEIDLTSFRIAAADCDPGDAVTYANQDSVVSLGCPIQKDAVYYAVGGGGGGGHGVPGQIVTFDELFAGDQPVIVGIGLANNLLKVHTVWTGIAVQ